MTHTCSKVVSGGSLTLSVLLAACSSAADPVESRFDAETPTGSDAAATTGNPADSDSGTEPAFDSGTNGTPMDASIADASTGDSSPDVDAGMPAIDAGPPPPKMPTLALGLLHSCAVRDGRLYCWGTNYQGLGQLGIGNVSGSRQPHPVDVPGEVVGVTAAWNSTCALNDRHELYCWGDNGVGQLGNGSRSGHETTPVRAYPEEGPFVYAASTYRTTCGRRPDGETVCWGDTLPGSNDFEFGVPQTSGPVQELAGGLYHRCARLLDQTVECWGYGGMAAGSFLPRQVSDLAGVQSLAVGSGTGDLVCVILTNGSVHCWGEVANTSEPTPVAGLPGAATAAATGYTHACALVDGRVFCWGANGAGQLGLGDREFRPDATEVHGLPGRALEVAAGGYRTCASFEGGGVSCWGRDDFSGFDDLRPVRITFP